MKTKIEFWWLKTLEKWETLEKGLAQGRAHTFLPT